MHVACTPTVHAMATLLTPAQVADLCQVRTETVVDWLRTGKLPGYKLGRVWRVDPVALDTWLRAQTS